jgi:ergothioneine biosynthesis protein EgtB
MDTAIPLEPLQERYAEARRRTREIFDLLAPEAFGQRPIPLRHPIRFYEGHLASFNLGMLLQSGFVDEDREPELTALFARGIDPLDEAAAAKASIHQWPEREIVGRYVERVEEQMRAALADGVEPLYLHTAIEHEEMHQETLMYLIHRLPHALKRAPADALVQRGAAPAAAGWCPFSGGKVQLGVERSKVPFGWDNEFPATQMEVQPFALQTRKVSNGDFLEFVNDGGYECEELWSPVAWRHLQEHQITAPQFWSQQDGEWLYRGAFEDLPLPPEWPVYVSYIEAQAYARWRGWRLPAEAEWQHALAQSSTAADPQRDNFGFAKWNPAPVSGGEQVEQLSGTGWEWTKSVFSGFPGFAAFPHYPGYSAEFFDDRHFVLKGASPVTPTPLVRPSFRNWFQDQYRHAYTAFRCARDL